MTKTNNKKAEAAAAKAKRALKARHLAFVCAGIETHRGSNGRIPRGVMQRVFEEHKEIYHWLTIDLVKKGLEKAKKNEVVVTETSTLSDLTNPTFEGSNQENNEPADPSPMNISNNQELETPLETSKRKVGRPCGTTLKALREKDAKKEALLNDIATSWSEKMQHEKSGERDRMKKNELDSLIKQKTEESGLTGVTIKKKSIQQRVYRKRLVVARHPGTESPMKPIEAYIVSMLNQMAIMRQPLCVSEGLALASALIEGTEWEQRLLDFKTKRGWKQENENGEKKPVLGKKWYRGFFNRNTHLLEKKATQKFAKDRSEWSVYRNFEQMYDEVYDAMEKAGVAKRLEEPMWADKEGNETEESKAHERKVTHVLTRPVMVIFVDEVGGNTSQEGDGAIGGQKKIVPRGTVPKESAATNTNHFTMLGFTAATGEPVMCALIMKGKTIKADSITGIDIFADVVGKESDKEFVKNNTGQGKRFPMGPTCTFRGKEVPCLVANTENASITSVLLASFLKHMDRLELFPRTDPNVKPFLLLDGHGSRLELPFLKYVNTEAHQWVVCIGVPYGTSYWQVGDSPEQNGCYKMALTSEKAALVLKKQRHCLPNPRVETYEIVIIVNLAWQRSFARVAYNKDAIAARGWGPLTRNLLDHPEILATKEADHVPQQIEEQDEPTDSQNSIVSTLNFGSGLSNTVMVDILQNIDRDNIRAQIRQNQEAGKQALEVLKQCKKLSAGTVFKSGRAWLGPEVLEAQLHRSRNKKQKEKELARKKVGEKEKRKQAYLKVSSEIAGLEESKWSVSQLKSLVNYKRRKTDSWQQPKTRADLLNKWAEIKHRETPPPSPVRDEDDSRDEDNIVEVAPV